MFSQTQLPLTSSSNQGMKPFQKKNQNMKATVEKKMQRPNDSIETNSTNLSN